MNAVVKLKVSRAAFDSWRATVNSTGGSGGGFTASGEWVAPVYKRGLDLDYRAMRAIARYIDCGSAGVWIDTALPNDEPDSQWIDLQFEIV